MPGVTSVRAHHYDFCTASSRISAAVARDGARTSMPPAWTDTVSLAMLADLKAASRGQRLLLEEQIATLSLWIWRQCALVRNDHIQLVAFSGLGTAATVLLVLAALVRLPKGLQDISRLEQAIVLPAMALLVASMSTVQLGEQQSHAQTNWTYYQQSLRLLAILRSSLANQQLLLPASPTADPPTSPAPLNDPRAVATLVNRLNVWLESVERGAVRVDNSFAQGMFSALEKRAGNDGKPGEAKVSVGMGAELVWAERYGLAHGHHTAVDPVQSAPAISAPRQSGCRFSQERNSRKADRRIVAASSSQMILSRFFSRMGLLKVMVKPVIPMIDRISDPQRA